MNGGTWFDHNGFGGSWTGPVVLAAKSFLGGSTGYSQSITGNISGPGGFTKSNGNSLTLSGTNTYTGPTIINAGGSVAFTDSAVLYGGNPASWTPSTITVACTATMVLNVGGTADFSPTQAAAALSGLTTGLNNNGLEAGSIFALDTTHAAAAVNFSANIADSLGTGGGSLNIAKYGSGTLQFSGSNTSMRTCRRSWLRPMRTAKTSRSWI